MSKVKEVGEVYAVILLDRDEGYSIPLAVYETLAGAEVRANALNEALDGKPYFVATIPKYEVSL